MVDKRAWVGELCILKSWEADFVLKFARPVNVLILHNRMMKRGLTSVIHRLNLRWVKTLEFTELDLPLVQN